MDYARHYDALILRAKAAPRDGYGEWHHITPRCLGGSDSAGNMVRLSAREHYTAHLLLVRIFPGCRALVFAAHMMTIGKNGRRVGNRKYEWLRKRHSEATSEAKRGNKYGVGKQPTAEERLRRSVAATGNQHSLGRVYSDDMRAKLSAAASGKKKSERHATSMSEARLRVSKTLAAYGDGSPRVPGVVQRPNGAFVARARIDGERRYLGFFWSLDDAKAAIDRATA